MKAFRRANDRQDRLSRCGEFWERGREIPEVAGGTHLGKYISIFYDSYMYSDI
jgi:hypothetical protein